MELIKKLKISEVELMDKEEFCGETCGLMEERCHFCDVVGKEEIGKWRRDKDRTIYILKSGKFMPRKCIWCGEQFSAKDLEKHVVECHKTEYQFIILNKVQEEVQRYTTMVRRTGRWWAMPFLFWRCPLCIEVDGICSPFRKQGKPQKRHVACIYSLGLDIPPPKNWEYYGIIIA